MLHQIGVGALGPVFRTYEPDRDRLVAVKVFRLDITPEQAQALADELSRAAEAGLFHPSIVEPIAAGVQGSVAYNAEEYVAAESLDVAMRHYAPARTETVLPFITQLAGAIDFARAAGVGHGALHPRDVFMTPDEARVTGFGVVEALERVGLRAPVRRPYSPPERIAGGRWSTEADVFSLAAITYELLTGRRPAGLGKEIEALHSGAEPLHDVLARAMEENPARRYPTALAFASALEAAARQSAAAVSDRSSAIATAAGTKPGALAAAAAATAATAALPTAPEPEPAAGFASVDDTLRAEDEDIAAERDEDEAHHGLARQEEDELERAAAVEQERDLGMDEDTEAEAEADRYAEDDFLLDAAGAASAPDLASADNFRAADAPVDLRALDDDEVMVDEPPSALFQPQDLRHEKDEPPTRRTRPLEPQPAAYQPSAPMFGQYTSPVVEPPHSEKSRWPLGLMLALGLLLGFGGGYAMWGRSAVPAGREWSEQAVNQPPPPERAATPAPGTSGNPSASAPPASNAGTPAAPAAPSPSASGPGAPRGNAPAGAAERPAGGLATAKPAPRATTGTLVVRSTPNGAGVTVNGRWRGRTPLTLEKLPFARYDVRVVQPGYAAAREAVTLSAGEPARSVSVRLQEQTRAAPTAERRPPSGAPVAAAAEKYTGTIFVDSRPRGARVSIDGKPVGVTPLSVAAIPIGSHVVRLELPDYRIWSTTATVSAGQQARVTGSLERIQ